MKDTSFKATGAKRKKVGGAKRGLTPFFAFLAEFRPQYLEKHPELKGVKEVSKAAGEKWRSMSDEEKAKYGGSKKQDGKASKKENTSSKKAKADVREGDEAEGSNKSKSEVEDDEQDGNEDEDE
ncbi:nucleosome/chromatin assembly factor D [Zea mays]|eukprot:NP_001105108.2 nucleosome/chromatin assembly factor D [Zea mays]